MNEQPTFIRGAQFKVSEELLFDVLQQAESILRSRWIRTTSMLEEVARVLQLPTSWRIESIKFDANDIDSIVRVLGDDLPEYQHDPPIIRLLYRTILSPDQSSFSKEFIGWEVV